MKKQRQSIVSDREAENVNRDHWDELAPVHLRSYGVDGLLAGVSRIDTIQRRELYPVRGKSLIHLQCHIGTDTLSLALDGAKVTGVDFSSKSLAIAKQLASRMNIDAEFIESNILDVTNVLSRQYDIVYTSKGVLCWISDIQRWGETVSQLLADNGTFYLFETHPALLMFDDTKAGALRIRYPYFHRDEPTHFNDDHPDYSDGSYIPKTKTYEWAWSLSDIVNALVGNGLVLEQLNEHDRLFYEALPGMVQGDDGWWVLEEYEGKIPLSFSIRARKPGSTRRRGSPPGRASI